VPDEDVGGAGAEGPKLGASRVDDVARDEVAASLGRREVHRELVDLFFFVFFVFFFLLPFTLRESDGERTRAAGARMGRGFEVEVR
jgi:hypothetical protein